MNKLELAPQFIQSIDWSLFKEQRQTLIDIASHNITNKNGDTIKTMAVDFDHIDGLINLCDSIVDYAVDVCGLDENEVLLNFED